MTTHAALLPISISAALVLSVSGCMARVEPAAEGDGYDVWEVDDQKADGDLSAATLPHGEFWAEERWSGEALGFVSITLASGSDRSISFRRTRDS